jgi:hypothetical protein
MTEHEPLPPLMPMVDGRFVDPSGSRVIIGILTCDKYKVRADGIRNSWLKLLPASYQVLFLHGRPGQTASLEGDRLYLDCPEAYEKLPVKVNAFLRYCLEHFQFDYLFKTDDDTYLDLERFIGFDKQGGDYIGQFRNLDGVDAARTWHYGKCEDKSLEIPYSGEFACPWATGGGYFLSRRAAALAAERTLATCHERLYEDLMIGEALTRDPGIAVVKHRFATMGVINPLLPKDMLYLQGVLLEKRGLIEQVASLRRENDLLRSGRPLPVPGS